MRHLLILPLCIGLLAACTSKPKVREPAPLQEIASPGVDTHVNWSRQVGHGALHSRLQVVAEADAVFVADQRGRVQALSVDAGRGIWEVRTGARLSAGPAVLDDLVLVGSLDGEVIALSRADGSERWRRTVSSEVLAAPTGLGILAVVRTVDGRVHGLDSSDGSVRWVFERSVPALTLRGLSPALVYGGRVFVGMDSGRMAALEGLTGQVAWEQLIAAPTGRSELERLADIDAAIVPAGRELYVASVGGEVASVDGDTGQVLWRRSISSYSGLVALEDRVIVTDLDGHVWALDARTGAGLWKQEALQYRRLSAPELLDGRVVVGDFEGYLHWLDPATGELVGRSRPARGPLQGAPQVLDSQLFVYQRDGRLTAIRLR